MLTVVNHVPDTVTTLMLISHLPGVQDLAMHLASRDSDHDAYMDAATRYPTSALTVLETEKTWAELDGQDARITKFKVPRAHYRVLLPGRVGLSPASSSGEEPPC
jgi:phosphohistidine phosphatase